MAGKSKIEWTGRTWNPIAGCDLESPGCTNCYAMAQAARIEAMTQGRTGNAADTHYNGTTKTVNGREVWTGKIAIAPDHVFEAPCRWPNPETVFVNSMSDLFHPDVPDAVVDRVFAIMLATPRHTYQVLTKRPDRMRDYMIRLIEHDDHPVGYHLDDMGFDPCFDVPPPNLWLGVSVEDGKRCARLDTLRDTPAALRFVSFEPLIGDGFDPDMRAIDWAIIGGESGPRARPFPVSAARRIIAACHQSGTAVFVKQMGRHAIMNRTDAVQACALGAGWRASANAAEGIVSFRQLKGADMAEWPSDLRIREMPEVKA